ncbi:MAG TPA: hypothetical protein VI319_12900 [Burkholderiales bacterium]
MSKIEQIEKQIQSLSEQELAEFRTWFAEFDHGLWDRQIEADSRSGKLDAMAAQALADYNAGKARKI